MRNKDHHAGNAPQNQSRTAAPVVNPALHAPIAPSPARDAVAGIGAVGVQQSTVPLRGTPTYEPKQGAGFAAPEPVPFPPVQEGKPDPIVPKVMANPSYVHDGTGMNTTATSAGASGVGAPRETTRGPGQLPDLGDRNAAPNVPGGASAPVGSPTTNPTLDPNAEQNARRQQNEDENKDR